MKLTIDGDALELAFEGLEKLWAFRFRTLRLPRSHVTGARTELPESSPFELRAPGTMVPGLIKAGTYYTRRGKELWYVTRGRKHQPLTIELHDHGLRRVALTIDGHDQHAERIAAWLRS